MRKSNLKRIVVVILVLVAVVLALLLLKQKMGTSSDALGNKNLGSPIAANWAPAPGTEKEYLFSIKNDAPEAEKQRHFFYATSISKVSEFLNLTNCNPDPLVIKVKNGEIIKLKNDGDADLSIGIDANHIYVVPAKSIKEVKADLGKGTGLYGYGCNASSTPAGMIFVEK